MEAVQAAYRVLHWCCVLALAVGTCFCLFRAIMGPRFTDRIVAVNIVCTKSIMLIAVLSFLLDEQGLLDIAMVYAMVSFLAVVVLSKCYLLPYLNRPVDTRQEALHIKEKGGKPR